MRTDPRHRRANVLAWAVILAVSGWIALSVARSGPGGSEKLVGRAETSAQQAIMTSLVNGMMAPPFRAQMGPQLSMMVGQVEGLAFPDDPGTELGTAALLTRLGARDKALGMLTGLRARVDSGEVQADAEFRTVLDATVELVDAAGAPGTRAIAEDRCEAVERALGPTGRMLVAEALGRTDELAKLEASGATALAAIVLVGLVALLLGLAGLAMLAVFVVLAALGRTKGVPPVPGDRNHVYAEMFAVWLVLYVGLGRAWDLLAPQLVARGAPVPTADVDLLISVLCAVVAGALGMCWGAQRGLGWRGVREGLGLVRPSAMDVVWGVATWSMGIVLLAGGLGIAMLLAALLGDGNVRPTHPVQQMIEDSGTTGLLLTYALACVCAPVFEEVFFRGALYRNLRTGLGRWGALGAPVAAAVLSSALFAAIHPQGLIFVPVLGSLALAFCIMREWRGTINASIVAHAINNGVVLSLNVVLLRG
jgi:membrane protease YdiL (CAAX protease family)